VVNLRIRHEITILTYFCQNTNVVALHGQVLRDADQNKYYNCGIGTYVPYQNKKSWKYWGQKLDNNLDLAFALSVPLFHLVFTAD
jgi:hypothetical protein